MKRLLLIVLLLLSHLTADAAKLPANYVVTYINGHYNEFYCRQIWKEYYILVDLAGVAYQIRGSDLQRILVHPRSLSQIQTQP